MILPIAEQAAEQIRSAQEWTIARSRSAYNDVISASRANMATIHHEFLCASLLPRFFTNICGQPGRSICADSFHLDYAGIRCGCVIQPMIMGGV
jgi:hypothetical protein